MDFARRQRPLGQAAGVGIRAMILTVAFAITVLVACSAGSVTGPNQGSSATVAGPGSPGPVATETNVPGDIPDSTAFVPYTSSAGFVVTVPEGWARSQSSATVTFTDKLNSVAIESTAAAASPTVASVTAAQVSALSSSVPKFQLQQISTLTRAAGSVVLVKYLADSAVNPVTGKVVRDAVELYLFWHSGTVVALTLTGPLGADNVDPWRRVTNSLSWTR